jgi:hypothetical protein
LALKAALCRFRFAFISLLFLIYSKPAKIEIYPWSNFRGPPLAAVVAWTENGSKYLHDLRAFALMTRQIDWPIPTPIGAPRRGLLPAVHLTRVSAAVAFRNARKASVCDCKEARGSMGISVPTAQDRLAGPAERVAVAL